MKKPTTRTVLLTITVLAVLGILTHLTITSEIIEMATSGSVKELREPMRPIRGETRVVLVGMDGVGAPVLYEAIRNGTMPNIAQLLGTPGDSTGRWQHGFGASGAMSVLPAETTAGWTAVLTGARPSESGVPGNEWFVRDSLAFFAPVPLSVKSHTHTLQIYTDGLIGKRIQVPTLFERVDSMRSHVSLGFVSRGADLLIPPNFSQLPSLMKSFTAAALGGEAVGEELYKTLDRTSVEGIREAANDYGLPDLQFAYFPGVDLLTHASDSALHRQHDYLSTVIDPAVGDLVQLYRDKGVLDQTYFVFTADHGHTPQRNHDRNALEEEPLALLDSLGLHLRAQTTESDSSGRYNAVFAANEAFAYIYLADRSTCPDTEKSCDWTRPPRFMQDMLPVARAFEEANQNGVRVPDLYETIDLILLRLPEADGFQAGSLQDASRAFTIDYDAVTKPPASSYYVFRNDSLFSIGHYLATHERDDLGMFEGRMDWITSGSYHHHAGDIALLAHGGSDRPEDQRFYFAAPHHSGHGSASMQDGEIPLLIAQPRSSGTQLEKLLFEIAGKNPSQLSVTPLVEGLLKQNRLK